MKTVLIAFLFVFAPYTANSKTLPIDKELVNFKQEIKIESLNSSLSCGPSYAVLKRGPRGGCYYINKNGNKSYVSRICCD